MNVNLIYRIERIIKDINADKFDQELIASLITCVREKSPPTSMVREIGDFLAHPTLKDRGYVHENIKKVHESLLKAYDKTTNQLYGKITIENPIDIRETITELKNTLLTIDKNIIISDEEKRMHEIQACILLLLQGSRIKIEHLDSIESVELRVAVNPSKFLCLMAALPTPLKVTNANGHPQYLAEIKYEIITSTMKFIPQNVDDSGFGFFNGMLNAKRGNDGKILYSLITSKLD